MNEKKLKFGDKWPYPYRGARYHFNTKEEVWWAAPLQLTRVQCISGHEEAVELLLKFKSSGGSFRITENKDIITKLVEESIDLEENGEQDAYYIGKLNTDMHFEHIDINPNEIRYGDIWPGFYDGASFHFNPMGQIWWRDSFGRRWFINKEYPHLLEKLLKWKRLGGSFRINEYGKVIALLERIPYPEYITKQLESFNDIQKGIIQYKVETTKLVPIYICDFQDYFEFEEPFNIEKKWTEQETDNFIDKLKNLGRY